MGSLPQSFLETTSVFQDYYLGHLSYLCLRCHQRTPQGVPLHGQLIYGLTGSYKVEGLLIILLLSSLERLLYLFKENATFLNLLLRCLEFRSTLRMDKSKAHQLFLQPFNINLLLVHCVD
ncbi:hypothetical protein V8G54_034014 [Vigna mungo]|uniref:Uncharacterized protein n=1 Tax=Vigna mungo TaxID=3915 RepID=A0AAQ3MQ05_VIGMU